MPVNGTINDMVPKSVKNLVPRVFVGFCAIKTFADVGNGWYDQVNQSCRECLFSAKGYGGEALRPSL